MTKPLEEWSGADFDHVPPGWTAESWADWCLYRAGRCAGQRDDLAEQYRRWAERLHSKMKTGVGHDR